MTTIAQRLHTADYINQLNFDYIETYSLQRGPVYEAHMEAWEKEYEPLRLRRENGKDLSAEEIARLRELSAMKENGQYLINEKGKFHFSCTRTHTFQHHDPKVDWLKQILNTAVTQIPRFLCGPDYRDAIVFYRADGTVVSCLNVCLSCMYMEIGPDQHLNGDWETYDLLKKFFIEMGHEVENPHHFMMDEIRKMKVKQNKPR